jgi:membrane associated rhomboid family serine protease
VLPVSLVCLFWEAGNAALIMTPAGVFRGQAWRLVTSLINQGGFLNLAFTLLVLAMTGPVTERQLGSMRFLLFLLAYGVLINLVFGIITVGATAAAVAVVANCCAVLSLQRSARAAAWQLLRRAEAWVCAAAIALAVAEGASTCAGVGAGALAARCRRRPQAVLIGAPGVCVCGRPAQRR